MPPALLTMLALGRRLVGPIAPLIGLFFAGLLMGWLVIGYPNGHADGLSEGDAAGYARGVIETRAAHVDAAQARAGANATIRRQAEERISDEMDLPDDPAALDERLRDICAGDANCRGERLLLDGSTSLEPVGHGGNDSGHPNP